MRDSLFLKRVLVAVLAAASVSAAAAAPSRIRPEPGSRSIKLKLGTKESTYHLATRAIPLVFKVEGPTPIRVFTRYFFPPGSSAASASYAVRFVIDGVELRTVSEQAPVSSRATSPDGRMVGALRSDLVMLPSGTHRLRVFPSDATTEIGVRLFRGYGSPKKIAWVPFAPDSYEQAARLHSGESEDVYYRFSVDKPAQFRINGPVPVKLLTRLDFGLERSYQQTYTIKIFLDGRLEKSFSLESRASHTSSYPELGEVTPGLARDSYFEVPRGRHEIQVVLDCTTARSAGLRVLIPKRAVTNGG
jgi:hypothetical protein